MIYDFGNYENAKIVGDRFRLMGETASQVDRPLSEVDTLTLVLDLTLARVQKLEALVAHLANARTGRAPSRPPQEFHDN
jgi:hypothetical protein